LILKAVTLCFIILVRIMIKAGGLCLPNFLKDKNLTSMSKVQSIDDCENPLCRAGFVELLYENSAISAEFGP
jgi:hypothetical protein